MAAIGALYPTLQDIVKRTNPDDTIARVAELQDKTNALVADMAWREGNLATGHQVTARTSLPSLTYRKFNQGIVSSKSTTEQYVETCAMLTGLSKVDTELANLNGNAAAFRRDEDIAFTKAFNIELANGMFYSTTTGTPEKYQGLAPRLNVTAGNVASTQIIKADATASGADQTSIWLIGWSPTTVYGIYPKGQRAGLQMDTDLPKQLVNDASGNSYTAWVTKWVWNIGLCVEDWRYLVRICNIDNSALKADLSTGADLVMSMYDAIAAIFEMNTVQPVFYMNRSTFSMFNKQLAKKGTVNLLEWIDRGGSRIAHFLGVPIRIVDAITNTEAVVV